MRLFFAIEVPDDLRKALAARQTALRIALEDCGYRWTAPEKFHITLAFLGEVDEHEVGGVCGACSQICSGVSPFWIEVRGFGTFPTPNHPRIIVAHASSEPRGAVENLALGLQRRFEGLGDCRPDKSFTPHITLARSSRALRGDLRERATATLNPLVEVPLGRFRAEAAFLFKSQVGQGAPKHTVLHSAPFAS